MVQEGAAAVASGPQAAGAAKKKKNKSKNKKKTAATTAQATTPTTGTAPQQQPSSSAVAASVSDHRSRSSSDDAKAEKSPQVAEPVVNRALPVAAQNPNVDLIENLAKEFAENYAVYSHWAETKDAEKLYHQQLAKHKV